MVCFMTAISRVAFHSFAIPFLFFQRSASPSAHLANHICCRFFGRCATRCCFTRLCCWHCLSADLLAGELDGCCFVSTPLLPPAFWPACSVAPFHFRLTGGRNLALEYSLTTLWQAAA